MNKTSLTKQEQISAISTLYGLLLENKTLEEISDEMELDVEEIVFLQRKLVELKTEELQRKPAEHIYVEYMIEQLKDIQSLSTIIKKYEKFDGNPRDLSPIVGAIKAKHELYNGVIKMGQQCGVIKKVPERRENVHGILVAELSSNELRQMIVKQWSKVARMTAKVEDDNIIDLPVPENLHYGDSIEIPKEDDDDIDEKEIEYVKPKKKAKKKKKKKKKKDLD